MNARDKNILTDLIATFTTNAEDAIKAIKVYGCMGEQTAAHRAIEQIEWELRRALLDLEASED
jgi:hypothetical protein